MRILMYDHVPQAELNSSARYYLHQYCVLSLCYVHVDDLTTLSSIFMKFTGVPKLGN